MNPDFLPAIGRSLRDIADFSTRAEINDTTLAELAAELERTLQLVTQAQGKRPPLNQCTRHPGGPVDPTADNGCLLCGTAVQRPAQPMPEGVEPGDVLRFLTEHGHDAATDRYGARAVTRALAIGRRHPSIPRPGRHAPARPNL